MLSQLELLILPSWWTISSWLRSLLPHAKDDQLSHSNPCIYAETSPNGQLLDEYGFVRQISRLLHFRSQFLMINSQPSIQPVHNQIGVTHNLNSYLISPTWVPIPRLVPLLHYVLLPLLFLLAFPSYASFLFQDCAVLSSF